MPARAQQRNLNEQMTRVLRLLPHSCQELAVRDKMLDHTRTRETQVEKKKYENFM